MLFDVDEGPESMNKSCYENGFRFFLAICEGNLPVTRTPLAVNGELDVFSDTILNKLLNE